MLRILLLIALLGLVSAHISPLSRLQQRKDIHHHFHHHHHRHPAHGHHPHHKKPKKIVDLAQLIDSKRPGSFLGMKFIKAQMQNQPAGKKFLTMAGKEERDVNATIVENNRDILVDAYVNKDGNFVVKDGQQHVVGQVEVHGANVKHFNIHKHRSGLNDINGVSTGNAVLNIEQDLKVKGSAQPKRRMQVHVEQKHDTHAVVNFIKLRPQPKYHARPLPASPVQMHRFRREATLESSQPCSENGCLNDVVA